MVVRMNETQLLDLIRRLTQEPYCAGSDQHPRHCHWCRAMNVLVMQGEDYYTRQRHDEDCPVVEAQAVLADQTDDLEALIVEKGAQSPDFEAKVEAALERRVAARGQPEFVVIPSDGTTPSFLLATKPVLEPDGKPRVNVSWYDAVNYCNERSTREGLEEVYDVGPYMHTAVRPKANGYRLPSEEEWVMAAGKEPKDLDAVAWYSGNCEELQVAGLKKPNEYGLFDMLGNVLEWCWDQHNASAAYRVMRGGSWRGLARDTRASFRLHWPPDSADDDVGFRPARNLPATGRMLPARG